MPLLPRSRRGTWLLAGAVWLAVSAGLSNGVQYKMKSCGIMANVNHQH